MAAPCNWEITTGCCDCWDTFDPGLQASATAWATEILWALSGRRFGTCEITVRPCMRLVGQTYRTYGVWTDWGYGGGGYNAVGPTWVPFIGVDGAWHNACGCSGFCTCEPTCQVWLPGPVAAVAEVRINNVIVPAENYRVDVANDGHFWLVGENGQCWPDCQNFDDPASGVDNTFVVTYGRGTPLPAAGAIAAGVLACEYAKLCRGDDCALSPQASTITRDGVTYTILPQDQIVALGMTGIASVDLWLRSVNPFQLKSRPRVWSPDMGTPRMTVVP